MLALPMMFTSCGNIDNPLENLGTQEVLTNLSSALEEGALVTITYTVDGVTYTSTFKKVGDDYVEQSTTSAARALTRASTSIRALIYYLGADNSYNFRAIEGEKIVLNVQIDIATATTTTTFSSNGATFGGMTVNGRKAKMTTDNDQTIKVLQKGSGNFLGYVGYKDGEKWKTLYEKESKNGNMIIQIIGSAVYYSNGFVSGQLYNDAGFSTPVAPDDQITQDVYVNVLTITYQEASWDATEKKVVYTEVPLDKYTLASPSGGGVTWSGGTYVVKDNVTIGGSIYLDGDVNLVLCDGATLTVNGMINGIGNSLSIYGQSKGGDAGYLIVKAGLMYFTNLTIHSGNIEVESEDFGICDSPLTVYGGILSITTDCPAIETDRASMTVYGGEVNAISKYGIGINLDDGDGTLTVYGGKVTAQGAEGKPAIQGKFTAGEGKNIGFFGRNSTSDGWTIIGGNTSDYRYFMLE